MAQPNAFQRWLARTSSGLGRVGDRIGAAGGRFADGGAKAMQQKFKGIGVSAPDFPLAHPTPKPAPKPRAGVWSLGRNPIAGLEADNAAMMARMDETDRHIADARRSGIRTGLRALANPAPSPTAPTPDPTPGPAQPPPPQPPAPAPSDSPAPAPAPEQPRTGIFVNGKEWHPGDKLRGLRSFQDSPEAQAVRNRNAINAASDRNAEAIRNRHGIRTLGTMTGAEAAARVAANPRLSAGGIFGRNDREAAMQRNRDFIRSGRASMFGPRPATTKGRLEMLRADQEEKRLAHESRLEGLRARDAKAARDEQARERQLDRDALAKEAAARRRFDWATMKADHDFQATENKNYLDALKKGGANGEVTEDEGRFLPGAKYDPATGSWYGMDGERRVDFSPSTAARALDNWQKGQWSSARLEEGRVGADYDLGDGQKVFLPFSQEYGQSWREAQENNLAGAAYNDATGLFESNGIPLNQYGQAQMSAQRARKDQEAAYARGVDGMTRPTYRKHRNLDEYRVAIDRAGNPAWISKDFEGGLPNGWSEIPAGYREYVMGLVNARRSRGDFDRI